MLSEEQVSEYLEGLVRLGIVERLPPVAGLELFRLNLRDDKLLGRILSGDFGELPDGVELVPWSACTIVKVLLQERGVTVTKEELAGMAAVFMGFLSEGAIIDGLRVRNGRPVYGAEGRYSSARDP
jgi:hypothetical protein